MARKKYKKSTWITVGLLIYVSVMAVYFLPRNSIISSTEKYISIFGSYAIILVLWLVLRKKENMQEKRFRDMDKDDNKK